MAKPGFNRIEWREIRDELDHFMQTDAYKSWWWWMKKRSGKLHEEEFGECTNTEVTRVGMEGRLGERRGVLVALRSFQELRKLAQQYSEIDDG